MVVVVSGSGTTVLGGLEGTVVAIVGSCAGETVVGQLSGTVVVVVRITGSKLVVVFLGTGAGSTLVEGSTGNRVEGLSGMLVVVVTV